jgi:hypothetical protein
MRIEVFAIPQFYEMDALFLGNLFNPKYAIRIHLRFETLKIISFREENSLHQNG